MSNDTTLDPETLTLLRRVDPVNGASVSDDAGLDVEAVLRIAQARATPAPPLPRRQRRRTGRAGRRALQLAVAAGAAGAAAVIVNVVPGGAGQISKVLHQAGLAVIPARADTIVARVRRELAPAPGAVVEVAATMVKSVPSGQTVAVTMHGWTDYRTHDSVEENSTNGGAIVTSGEIHGEPVFYNPSTNTIDVMSHPSALEAAEGSSPQSSAVALAKKRGVTVNRNARYDGAAAIELSYVQGPIKTELYVEPGTYAPLEWRQGPAANAPRDEQAGSVVMKFSIYRTLTGAQAARSLVSLTDQHPSASVVHLNSDAWSAAFDQLH